MASFYVENFGCRATQADGAALERQFRDRGLHRAPAPEQAELVVLNTCTVTAAADQDARAAIRRIHRENPACQIIVTGCYAQRAPEEIAALPGVTLVVGNSHKHQLAEIAQAGPQISALGQPRNFVPLTQLTPKTRGPRSDVRGPIYVSDIFAHTELLAAPVFDSANERTRPNLKIQDGCDNRCSFCVIPFVRGQSRSLKLDEILREVKTLVDAGYRELVISGINLGRWGLDLQPEDLWEEHNFKSWEHESGGHDFQSCHPSPEIVAASAAEVRFQLLATNHQPLPSLIRSILNETPLEKLRISSVEPMDWSDDLIALMASSPRIAKHAHVPMQSGSDAVLRRMHRKYRPWHYRQKIESIRAAMPTAAIGADVMVGFPGETNAEFEETRRLVEDLPFTYLHVFTYSARPGTPAATMPNQIPVQVARERNRILRNVAAEKKQRFMLSFVGKTIPAITLKPGDTHFTEALTDNYLKLRLKGHHSPNRWLATRVNCVEDGILIGTAS